MKIGVSSYSFSQYLSNGKLDLFGAIKKAAEMGFEAIEFTGFDKDTFEEKKELAKDVVKVAKDSGIEISAYVCGGNLLCNTKEEQDKEVERLKSEIDIANELGVKLFRYDVLFKLPSMLSFDMALEKVVGAMKELADYGEKYGIMTMIENHGYTFQDYDRVEKVYNAVGHENFSLLVDIGNFMCADQEPYICVSRIANLASHVHMKDFIKKDFYSGDSKEHCFMTRGANYLRGTAVGYGDAGSAQCLQILKNAGYDGYVDIEFEGPEDCIEELQRGLDFLKKNI